MIRLIDEYSRAARRVTASLLIFVDVVATMDGDGDGDGSRHAAGDGWSKFSGFLRNCHEEFVMIVFIVMVAVLLILAELC
jgi:hypothetical protein